MRALVIGRGSMGRRRIRDLTALGVEVDSIDPMAGEVSRDFLNYDFRVISTPPLTKQPWLSAGGPPAFTEADVEAYPFAHLPSATSRFTSWYPMIPANVLDYTLHVGQHIDDWHPGEDRATYYAYRDDLALREMLPFELCWLTGKFSPVTSTLGKIRPGSELPAMVEHATGVTGIITIDVVSRPAVRRIVYRSRDDGQYRSVDLRYTEADYLAEMRALVRAVKGEQPWPYSQAEERANIEVLHTIERSV